MSIRNYITEALRQFRGSAGESADNSRLACGEVCIESVSKRFRKRTATRSSYTTVKSGLLKQERRTSGEDEGYFYALNDVSFHIKPGSALGVIGRNGSGKSTLLKLISGIYLPDSGHVQHRGRISALIELGAGFHPDFSGRENIYLGGVMYGLSRSEIDQRYDAIVEYAELAHCIDDPVRTYSSGMYMRLGFSLAVHTDPDILLIDEVLAVGDAAFIAKCQDTISEMKRRGKTLIFVTHDLPSVVRWCDEVVWLTQGVVTQRGEPRRVIDAYIAEVEDGQREVLNEENAKRSEEPGRGEEGDAAQRWGSKDVELFDVTMLRDQQEANWLFEQDDSVTVEFQYRINSPIKDLVFGVGIERLDGLQVHGTNTELEGLEVLLPQDAAEYPRQGVLRYRIARLGLVEGSYYLDVAAHSSDGYSYDYHHRMHKFSVRNKAKTVGVYTPKAEWEIDSRVEEIVDAASYRKQALG